MINLGLAVLAGIVLMLMGAATYAVITDKVDRYGHIIATGIVGLMALYAALGVFYAVSVGSTDCLTSIC